ncbi:hypothetical protein [Wenzhouxiangella marina]|uniref:Uncharacterized protein n=1 Tax=Wenzhouxiangella marina TaxID=1579979 RepID=A0A0K0Y031_9GAMM|nr:hypothetical protein [Wenzhouxiangella marina]AKS43247.1 hypothetical protein WM2015_2890 [Wenzhouxiangella marina]MBB6087066.1 hypothetical protein [Wenzhouxiangella marina]
MNRILTISLLALFTAACAGGGQNNRSSGSELEPPPFANEPRNVDVDEYLEFLDELAVAIGEGVPRELNTREREQYRDADTRLRSILEPVSNVSELSDENQLTVFNLHQELQGIVVGDPENYLICSRRSTVGTHFKRTTCMPAGDFRRQQERNREALRNRLGPGPMPVLQTP